MEISIFLRYKKNWRYKNVNIHPATQNRARLPQSYGFLRPFPGNTCVIAILLIAIFLLQYFYCNIFYCNIIDCDIIDCNIIDCDIFYCNILIAILLIALLLIAILLIAIGETAKQQLPVSSIEELSDAVRSNITRSSRDEQHWLLLRHLRGGAGYFW